MTASWCGEDVVRRAGVLFVERVDSVSVSAACKSLSTATQHPSRVRASRGRQEEIRMLKACTRAPCTVLRAACMRRRLSVGLAVASLSLPTLLLTTSCGVQGDPQRPEGSSAYPSTYPDPTSLEPPSPHVSAPTQHRTPIKILRRMKHHDCVMV